MADPRAEAGRGIEQGWWVVAQTQHMAVGSLYRTVPSSPRSVIGLAGWRETPRVLLKLFFVGHESWAPYLVEWVRTGD